MAELNPDFRGADEVIIPGSLRDLCGWTDGQLSSDEAYSREQRGLDRLEADMPVAFRARPAIEVRPAILQKWTEFQESKGRYEGSADWSLLDEFTIGQPLLWLPQIIGSCVVSNTLRPWVTRLMYQIVMLGRAEEYLGRNEFGPQNFSFYGPFTYGMARRRANMRGGDGLYCEPMTESLMKDGVLSCSTPALLSLLKGKGLASENDLPEPQGNDGARLYREFGAWQYIDSLKQYADFPVTESPRVRNGDELWDLLGSGKAAYVCSSEAIHKVGTHPDGFAIHARNPSDRWDHNMSFPGRFVASDGERFIRESNESWGKTHIYNRRLSEVDKNLRTGGLTCQAIGNIDGPRSTPPMV